MHAPSFIAAFKMFDRDSLVSLPPMRIPPFFKQSRKVIENSYGFCIFSLCPAKSHWVLGILPMLKQSLEPASKNSVMFVPVQIALECRRERP